MWRQRKGEKNKKHHHGGAGGADGAEGEGADTGDSDADPSSSSRGSTSSDQDDGGTDDDGGAESSDDDDDDQKALESFITAWTPNKAKMKRTKDAMKLAAQGAAISKIGLLHPDNQALQLENTRENLFTEYKMPNEITEELTDLRALTKFKCLRYWLPSMMVWLEELRLSRDEMKVNVMDRRQVHKNSILFTLQLCERMMFSLYELLLWQQEGFNAMFALEEQCQLPPPSRRFLPYREGEVDDFARTPRDSKDAEELAPDESVVINRGMTRTMTATNTMTGLGSGSFGASEIMASSDFDQSKDQSKDASTLGRTNTAAFSEAGAEGEQGPVDLKARRLDRNVVRVRKERANALGDKKLQDLANKSMLKASQSFVGSVSRL
jgi:hypothetical protein